jgi:hypothetical protein
VLLRTPCGCRSGLSDAAARFWSAAESDERGLTGWRHARQGDLVDRVAVAVPLHLACRPSAASERAWLEAVEARSSTATTARGRRRRGVAFGRPLFPSTTAAAGSMVEPHAAEDISVSLHGARSGVATRWGDLRPRRLALRQRAAGEQQARSGRASEQQGLCMYGIWMWLWPSRDMHRGPRRRRCGLSLCARESGTPRRRNGLAPRSSLAAT